jgi:hypothetical protein
MRDFILFAYLIHLHYKNISDAKIGVGVHGNNILLRSNSVLDGFGGLVVSMLASGS